MQVPLSWAQSEVTRAHWRDDLVLEHAVDVLPGRAKSLEVSVFLVAAHLSEVLAIFARLQTKLADVLIVSGCSSALESDPGDGSRLVEVDLYGDITEAIGQMFQF